MTATIIGLLLVAPVACGVDISVVQGDGGEVVMATMLEIRCDHCDALNAFSTVRGICADCFVAGHRPTNCQPCRDEAEATVARLKLAQGDNIECR